MYQHTESREPDLNYTQRWCSEMINSLGFKEQNNHRNPNLPFPFSS